MTARPARYLAHLVLLFAVLFTLSPLASEGFNGFTPEQFPVVQDRWPVQPAGWAFSIWGVIFLWLIAGSLVGLVRAPREPDWQAMRAPLLASLAAGTFWIAAANASPLLATVMIVAMAAAAIAALLRAGRGAALWQAGPVGLYAGWLTAATGVALGVVLSGHGVLAPRLAALVLIPAVLGVALWVQARRPSGWSYPLAVIWALAGIVAANLAAGDAAVAGLAAAGIAVLAFAAIRWRRAA